MMRLSDEQVRYVRADGERLILSAPAGSGKTEVVSARVRRLVKAGKSVRVLCFTNAAKDAISKRLVSSGIFNVEVSTISAAALDLMLKYFPASFDYGDGIDIARSVSRRSPVSASQVLFVESHLANNLPLSSADAAGTDLGVLFEVFQRFQQRKARDRYLSFVDLTSLAVSFAHHLKVDEVIVDEAQDLTSSQLAFVRAIGSESVSLAGDPHQAIFGFSGVDPLLLPGLVGEGWSEYRLTKTFRVPRNLVDVVSAVRGEKLRSARSGGVVSALGGDYSALVGRVAADLVPGDVVLGLERKSLSGVLNRVSALRPDLAFGSSWAGPGGADVLFSTIHSAKGGEWNRVFVWGVDAQGLSSFNFTRLDEAAMRRLGYVAVSRAMNELVLVSFDGKLPFGFNVPVEGVK